MHVQILLFGSLKDVVPEIRRRELEAEDLPDDMTVAELLQRLLEIAPEIQAYAGSLAVAVNREYVLPAHPLHAEDEVALLPPVSGGSGGDAVRQKEFDGNDEIGLQRNEIDTTALITRVKEAESGAVVVFDGIVRNHTRGRRTLFLDYEAYEAMAVAQMRGLAQEAKERFGIRRVALVHRLGRLQVGETSVLIAVASAHRAQAFEACRWVIDTLKTKVPIWKKEWFEDGAVWAAGEPFPSELSATVIKVENSV